MINIQRAISKFAKQLSNVSKACCTSCWTVLPPEESVARSKNFHIIRVHLQSSLLFDFEISQDNSSHIFIEFQFKINYDLKT